MFLLDKDHTISKKEQYKSRARFITSEENDYDDCRSYYGPQFDRIDTYESFLDIINDKHKRKLLLYGNSNQLTIYDYEVYEIDYENRENINKLCKYPDIIMEYIETKGISDESLKQFEDDTELLTDLDAIHCKDSIRVKISNYYLKNPSEFLSGTKIVNKQYDSKLREWFGYYKWKLHYRAFSYTYLAKYFHYYCDNKGPTLIIIKSSGGWIFGGYTNQSWSGNRIYNDMT